MLGHNPGMIIWSMILWSQPGWEDPWPNINDRIIPDITSILELIGPNAIEITLSKLYIFILIHYM